MSRTQINAFDISGKVVEVGEVERINEKFSKRTLVMEIVNGRYTCEVPFEFKNENMKQLEGVNRGNWVTIHFQLNANKKNREGEPVRRFTSLEAVSCFKEN